METVHAAAIVVFNLGKVVPIILQKDVAVELSLLFWDEKLNGKSSKVKFPNKKKVGDLPGSGDVVLACVPRFIGLDCTGDPPSGDFASNIPALA